MTITRRRFLASVAGAVAVPYPCLWTLRGQPQPPAKPLGSSGQRPVPSPSQLLWQQDELALFIHFGVNTFTDREWGDGTEDPAIFVPSRFDARQWARTAREAGFRAMILTAKHHDGFCLWQTRYTDHSVASSRWRKEKPIVKYFPGNAGRAGEKEDSYGIGEHP